MFLNGTRFSEGRQYVEDHELPACPDSWSECGKLRTLMRISSFSIRVISDELKMFKDMI
jgi:hypothetical protein